MHCPEQPDLLSASILAVASAGALQRRVSKSLSLELESVKNSDSFESRLAGGCRAGGGARARLRRQAAAQKEHSCTGPLGSRGDHGRGDRDRPAARRVPESAMRRITSWT